MSKATAHHTHVSAVVELQQRYDGPIPAAELAAARAADSAQRERFQKLNPIDQAAELVVSQADVVASDRRFILAILAKRRELRTFLLSTIGQENTSGYLGSNFVPLVRAKAALDAAERDARFHIKFYRANKALLLKFRSDLAAASAPVAV